MTGDIRQAPLHTLQNLLTIGQTAEVLQVSTKTIRRWIKNGDLIAHRLGHQWRISKSDLQSFIRMRRQG